MQAKAFNPQIFLELLCYSAFGGLMLYLVNSGKYLSYVTPRMEPYLYFTAIVMGIWALAGLGRLFRPQHRIRCAHCLVLVIPILLLLLPHSPLSTSDLSGNYIGNTFSGRSGQSSYGAPSGQAPAGGSGGSPTENPAKTSPKPADDPSASGDNNLPAEDAAPTDSLDTTGSDTPNDVPEEGYSTDLPGLDTANKRITVSNDDFSMWLAELYINMEKYKGYTVVMTGFVFKDSTILKKDEFIPARLMMSCCAADLTPAGLLCKYDKASALKADSWVTVEGTIFIGQYEYVDGKKYDEPQVAVTKITPAEKVEGYVYP